MPTEEELRRWETEHIPEYMGKLREAYEAVYNDPYREVGHGYFKRYLMKYGRMIDAMSTAVGWVQMLRGYQHKNDPEIGPLKFFHEVYHYVENCKYHTKLSEDSGAMVILEKYLMQVHRFLDTKVFDRFSVYMSHPGDSKTWQWWDYVWVEKDHIYSIADEYIEDFDKVYHITLTFKQRPEFFEGKDRISRSFASVLRRVKEQQKARPKKRA